MVRYLRNKDLEKKIIDYLVKKGAKRIEIFGSYVRGENYNDIDVLVEFDKTPGLEFFRYENDLKQLTNKKVDLLTEESFSKYVWSYIAKEKETIYEKN